MWLDNEYKVDLRALGAVINQIIVIDHELPAWRVTFLLVPPPSLSPFQLPPLSSLEPLLLSFSNQHRYPSATI